MLNTQDLLQLIQERDLRDFQGTHIESKVPISEDLVNRVALEQTRSNEMLEHLEILFPGNNNIIVKVKAKVDTKVLGIKIPIKRKIKLHIERDIPLSPSPLIRIHILEGMSGLEKVAFKFLENLISKAVPGEVSLKRDLLTIDLGPIVRKKQLGYALDKIKEVAIEGRVGWLILFTTIQFD